MSDIKVNARELAGAVEAGVLNPGQDSALLAYLQGLHAQRPSFQLSHVAFYFGALLIMAAMGWLLSEAWMEVSHLARLLLCVSYMLGLGFAGFRLWQRDLQIPGGLLCAAAVSLTPLVIFAIQLTLGIWPDQEQFKYEHYYRFVQASWIPMEVGTVIVGLLMLRVVPFPFIVMPMALALWFMSMDLTSMLYGHELSWSNRANVSLWFGLGLLVVSLLLDNRFQRDFAFWGYFAGLLAFWGGLTSIDSGSEWGKALYCLINLILMLVAVLLRRPVFMVFGALGVAGYLAYLSNLFDNSLLFPIFLSAIGLAVIFLGMSYQRHRQALTEKLRRYVPAVLLDNLPALRR